MWRQGAWDEVDLLHQGNATFANLARITERLPSLKGMSKWTELADVDVRFSTDVGIVANKITGGWHCLSEMRPESTRDTLD